MKKKEPSNFFAKIFYKLSLLINPDDVLTRDAQLAFDIFETSLNNPENMYLLNTDLSSEKYIVPKSYYTTVEDNSIHNSTCIILNSFEKKITIVNHQYQYDISIPMKTCGIMDQMFNDKIYDERQKMKNEILKNAIKSLEIVLQNLKINQ